MKTQLELGFVLFVLNSIFHHFFELEEEIRVSYWSSV
jgi:hypothetical protein